VCVRSLLVGGYGVEVYLAGFWYCTADIAGMSVAIGRPECRTRRMPSLLDLGDGPFYLPFAVLLVYAILFARSLAVGDGLD
jgi:hypothetical protein